MKFGKSRQERGASGTEYGIIVGLISVVAIGSVFVTGKEIQSIFSGSTSRIADGGTGAAPGGATPAPDPFNPDQYGLDTTDWLIGTPNADTLAMSGEPGVQGLQGNDVITGTSGAEIFIGGPGNDVISGGLGNDTYYYAAGDGSDVITDAGANYSSPKNTLFMMGYNSSDVVFDRSGSTDVTMALADGPVLTFTDQGGSSEVNGMQIMSFEDKTLDSQGLRDRLVEDMKLHGGHAIGSSLQENYVFNAGDPSYMVTDVNSYSFQKHDTFTFSGFNQGSVTLSRSGDDMIATLGSGAVVTFDRALKGNEAYIIPNWTFADATMDAVGIRSKMVEDMKPTGTVVGTPAQEDYVVRDGDPSYTVTDVNTHDFQKDDTLTFDSLSRADVTLSRSGNDMIATLGSGTVVTFDQALTGGDKNLVPNWIFNDATLDAVGIRSKMVNDMKPTGIVVGTTEKENYVYANGEGSYSVEDYNTYSFQKNDTFAFTDLAQAGVTLSGSGEDMIAQTPAGDTITFKNALIYGSKEMIPSWTFTDATMDDVGIRSKMVADMKPTGVVHASQNKEIFHHANGDGSYIIEHNNPGSSFHPQTDIFHFDDLTPAQVVFALAGNDITMTTPAGDVITVREAGSASRARFNQIVFSDGTTYSESDMLTAAGG